MTVYRRSPEVLWRDSVDRVVLLPSAAATPITVDGPGQALWALLEEPKSVESLVESLASLYAVDTSTVREALDSLLVELRDIGAIEPVGSLQ